MTQATPALDAARLRAALALPAFDGRAAQRALEPLFRGLPPPARRSEPPRDGAALLYACPGPEGLVFPLTLRREDLAEHRGQVSLPGGRPEAGEALWEAALREAREEVGLRAREVERLGVLAPVYIPVSHTHLHVHVALGPAQAQWVAQASEVARIEVVALGGLLDPARRAIRVRHLRGADLEVPTFLLGGLEVWGATAMALSELAERLWAAPAP
ncbi:MAG: NUDIX hydrolase [Planctomycetia bacterium]